MENSFFPTEYQDIQMFLHKRRNTSNEVSQVRFDKQISDKGDMLQAAFDRTKSNSLWRKSWSVQPY